MRYQSSAIILSTVLAACLLGGCSSEAAHSSTNSAQIPDGSYTMEVTLSGGSGRASVASPAPFLVEEGQYTATIVWSSSNYDYMLIDGVRYDTVNTDGNSSFEIPVTILDEPIAVQADTTAMSEAHLIDYTLTFDSSTLCDENGMSDSLSSDENEEDSFTGAGAEVKPLSDASGEALAVLGTKVPLALSYAEQFTVDTYEDGYALISVAGSDYFLLVPEGKEVPAGLGEEVTIIRGPLSNIYLAASSAMDLFRELGALDCISMTATSGENWSIPEIKTAASSGKIQYVGKYSAPDYETILSKKCSLAIESTMIYHSPEVKEQLKTLGIPVLVEHSSYESHPLGRMEWIKLYGLLTGHLEEAEAFFNDSIDRIEHLDTTSSEGRSVVFFYISSSGYVNVRKPGDYISKMITMAGGKYALTSIEAADDNSSTMNMQMETFYAEAKDADILIYNSTTEGTIDSMSQLLGKSELLADFKAVKEGNVWCTGQNMFQQTTGAADMVTDINHIITGEADGLTDLTFLHRIK